MVTKEARPQIPAQPGPDISPFHTAGLCFELIKELYCLNFSYTVGDGTVQMASAEWVRWLLRQGEAQQGAGRARMRAARHG